MEIEIKSRTPVDPAIERRDIAIDIENEIKSLEPPLSDQCCIYRVPIDIRRVNEEAYTPQVVSIGPFHHGKKNLKKMEKYKVRSVDKFLRQTNKSLNDVIKLIKDDQETIKNCYAENLDHIDIDKFVKMILLDAAFIIETFLGAKVIDFPLDKPGLQNCISGDLKLLENQLPFYLLEKLYGLIPPDLNPDLEVARFPTFLHRVLACNELDDIDQGKSLGKVKHITDLMRRSMLPAAQETTNNKYGCIPGCHNPTKLSPDKVKRCVAQSQNKGERNHVRYSATQLHEAGVKFIKSSSKSILDIKLSNGRLHLPYFEACDGTERQIRNIMAFEQCHHPNETHVCDYMVLMDCLIDKAEDAALLSRKKIIYHWLGDDQAVATLFNKLCKGILADTDKSKYSALYEQLNIYYNKPYHSWKAALTREYFKTPWRAASTVAAVTLLVLTLIQTGYSIKSGRG